MKPHRGTTTILSARQRQSSNPDDPEFHLSREYYISSGFGNRLTFGAHPALLLIDVCAAYFTPGSPLDISDSCPSGASACLTGIKNLLSAARESKVPTIWTQVAYEKGMRGAGLFYRKCKVLDVFEEGDPRGYANWVEGLEPKRGEEDVLVKKHPRAFFGTELASRLHLMGVDTVVIAGVSTSGCVRVTALDAVCCNFRPMVVGSACGDRTPEIHGANLFDMDAKMADVVGGVEAVERLRVGWK